MNDCTTKVCPMCKRELPYNLTHYGKNRSTKSGLTHYCRLCKRELIRVRRENERAKRGYIPLADDERQCPTCKKILPATREHFSTNKMGKNGLTSYCKNCAAQKQKQYRKLNPERVRKTERKRNKKPERMENQRKRNREYYKSHPYKKEMMKAKNNKRRAHLKGAKGSHTKEDILKIYASQKGKCWWCEKAVGKNFHIDHRIPISRGGSNDPSNLVVTCPFCNYSKNDRLPHEWSDRLL